MRGWTCSSQVEEWVLSPVTPLKWTFFGRLHKQSNFLCKGVDFFHSFSILWDIGACRSAGQCVWAPGQPAKNLAFLQSSVFGF